MDDAREYGLFIEGKFLPAASRQTVDSIDPATGEVVARVARAGRRDARRAIEAARRAADDGVWSGRSVEDRRDALLAVCDRLDESRTELAALEARDAGMTIRDATITVATAIQHARELIRLAASIPPVETVPLPEPAPQGKSMLVRDPCGVVAAIVPSTTPFLLAVWKVFPALAMGNSVVLQPSPLTPCTAMELAVAFAGSDVPPGVLNVVPGGGAETGEELAANPLVDMISFTGSTETGRRVAALAAPTVKRVSLALGGKCANILLEDADLDVAIPGALWATYLHQGQTCRAGTRLLVPDRIHDEVVDRIVSAATQLRTGPTTSWESDLGPLVSRECLERVERFVRTGRDEGATLACGGHRLTDEGLRDGFFYAPTVFTNVRNEMRIAQEEILGPVLAVIPYRDAEEAVATTNASTYGLAAAVWSRDASRALTTAMRLTVGTVWINDYHVLTTAVPWGGHRQSGVGEELGIAGCLAYTRSKHVWIDHTPHGQPRAWMPALGLDRIFGIDWE